MSAKIKKEVEHEQLRDNTDTDTLRKLNGLRCLFFFFDVFIYFRFDCIYVIFFCSSM